MAIVQVVITVLAIITLHPLASAVRVTIALLVSMNQIQMASSVQLVTFALKVLKFLSGVTLDSTRMKLPKPLARYTLLDV